MYINKYDGKEEADLGIVIEQFPVPSRFKFPYHRIISISLTLEQITRNLERDGAAGRWEGLGNYRLEMRSRLDAIKTKTGKHTKKKRK
jgi:hypothetical protein